MRSNHSMRRRQIQQKFRISYYIFADTQVRIDLDRPNNNDRQSPLIISAPHTIPSSPQSIHSSSPADTSHPPPPPVSSQSLYQNQSATQMLPILQVQTQNHLPLPDLEHRNQSDSQLLPPSEDNQNQLDLCDDFFSDECTSDLDFDQITVDPLFLF